MLQTALQTALQTDIYLYRKVRKMAKEDFKNKNYKIADLEMNSFIGWFFYKEINEANNKFLFTDDESIKERLKNIALELNKDLVERGNEAIKDSEKRVEKSFEWFSENFCIKKQTTNNNSEKIYYKQRLDGSKEWFLNGKFHKEDGPACEYSSGIKEWWLNGKRHRTDGPAVEYPDGTKHWYLNGKPHRLDGPAFEWCNGNKEWRLNGKRHRTDGPAYEGANGSKFWFLNGKPHRIDGPAIEYIDGSKEYYLNGKDLYESLKEIDHDYVMVKETNTSALLITKEYMFWAPKMHFWDYKQNEEPTFIVIEHDEKTAKILTQDKVIYIKRKKF